MFINNHATGYGPSATSRSRLYFSGQAEDFKIWETRFINYIYTLDKGVYKAILPSEEGVADDEDYSDKNRRAYAELVQVLDERSLMLIIHENNGDGRAAFKTLKSHYDSTEKPRVLALYEQLTTVSMMPNENVTDYLIRAEKAANGLRAAGENITDNLVIAMILKGLTDFYKPFVVVHTQLDKYKTLVEFKAALVNYTDTESARAPMTQSNALSSASQTVEATQKQTHANKTQCLYCGKSNHKSKDCRVKNRLTCNFCKKQGHIEKMCFTKKRQQAHPHQSMANATVSHENDYSFTTTHNRPVPRNNTFLVDCGASSHMINDKSLFVSLDSTFEPTDHFIELADGRRRNDLAEGQGDAKIEMFNSQGVQYNITLKGALYTPEFPISLFSVRAATEAGASLVFSKTGASLTHRGTKFDITQKGNLYFLPTNPHNSINNACVTRTLEEWHKILGHMNFDDIVQLQAVTNGMTISKQGCTNKHCKICSTNKMCRQPKSSNVSVIKATKPLQRVHSDICGPITPTSQEGYKYIINFVDEFSGMLFVYCLRTKDEAAQALKNFISDVSPIGRVLEIHSDNGGEYTSQAFRQILCDNSIKQTTTSPYSPFENGKSERSWRSLLDMARCLRDEADIPKYYWPYVVKHAQYLRNRSFQRRTKKTAYELFCGQKPNLKNLHIFGSPCVSYVEGHKQKFDHRGQNGKYFGINPSSGGFFVLIPEKNRVITSRNVVIHDEIQIETQHDEILDEVQQHLESKSIEVEFDCASNNMNKDIEYHPESEDLRPKRDSKLPKHLEDYQVYMSTNVDYAYRAMLNVPQTYEEAISSEDSQQWKTAMDREIQTLKQNDTYDLVTLPVDRAETKGKWVYTLKQGRRPEEVRYKARYVAKGYSQISGVDYDETFSPTMNMTSVRILLQKAVNENFKLHQLDVKGAYLNAPIDKEIYVEQPPGYVEYKHGQKLTCRLNKSLYGLKQSGRNWNQTLTSFLQESGFRNSDVDPCVFINNDTLTPTIIVFWVDDLIIGSPDENHIEHLKQLLSNRFKMDDRGELRWFLGIDFKKLENGCYKMSQEKYAEAILKRFGMFDCNPAPTPFHTGTSLEKPSEEEHTKFSQQNFPYRQAVGSLLYLAQTTRPDLCWSVSKLSQFLDKPGITHVTAIKHVLRYLKGTKSYCLMYKPSDGKLSAFSDSDWAGDLVDRRSTSGYVCTLGSAPISWKTRKQQTVALSSCEAEFIAITESIKELLYLQLLCKDFNINQPNVTIMYCDNQGAIALTKESPKKHQRTKHIDVRFNFIRSQKNIDVKYVCSKDNLADIMTKPLGKMIHNKLTRLLQHTDTD